MLISDITALQLFNFKEVYMYLHYIMVKPYLLLFSFAQILWIALFVL